MSSSYIITNLILTKDAQIVMSQIKKQVTRGHNIIANGWAGADNPNPHPRPPHTHSHGETITAATSKCVFSHFPTQSPQMDQRTDERTNGRTKPLIELRVQD